MKYFFMLLLITGAHRVFSKLKLSIFAVFLLPMLATQSSYALGLGEVKLESYIGEQLFASIPVLSVIDANSLVVEITSLNSVDLQSSVRVIDNQVSIRVTSEQLINEPYVQFNLRVVDQTQILVREFTALLDIKQDTVYSTQSTNTATPYNAAQVSPELISSSSPIADILGPYEWAQPGRIPARFGPVLDGQSLWRVARRINSAMGVTIDQMMWALYTNNPSAFSTNTIESLQAGVYLDIPKIYEVSNTSNTQAKQSLDNASNNNMIVQAADDVAASTGTVDESAEVGLDGEVDQSLSTDESQLEPEIDPVAPVEAEFKLSGIDEVSGVDSSNPQASNEQAIETINVLSVTVGNLTQELIAKDKQIEYLEDKIGALESVAALDAISAESSLGTTPTTTSNAAAPNAVVPTNAIVTPTSAVAPPITDLQTNRKSLIESWMLWLGLGLIALFGGLALRNKIKGANLFGRVDNIDLHTQMSTTTPTARGLENRDYSELSASDPKSENTHVDDNQDDDDIEYNSFAEISVNYIDEDDITDIKSMALAQDKDLTDFERELESLSQQGDFDGLAVLLESSRNKVIDDDRYYFERLRCYFEKKDEDGFYAFYDEIEYSIQRFPEKWNHQISEMVIKLGQTK